MKLRPFTINNVDELRYLQANDSKPTTIKTTKSIHDAKITSWTGILKLEIYDVVLQEMSSHMLYDTTLFPLNWRQWHDRLVKPTTILGTHHQNILLGMENRHFLLTKFFNFCVYFVEYYKQPQTKQKKV